MLLVISCILHSHFSSMKKGAGSRMGLNLKSFLSVFCRGLTLQREGNLGAQERRSSSSFLFARQSCRFRNFGG